MSIDFPGQEFYTIIAAISYYFYNDRMFLYISLIMKKKRPVVISRIFTFLINYMVFMLISNLQFYLIINWTIFAFFLIFEIGVIYRCPIKMSLFCGLQGALVGLAINFITRSGAAFLLNQPLVAFDSRFNMAIVNLKAYPICLGFLLSGLAFSWMFHHFSQWAEHEENPDKPANLTFSLCLVAALFIYLDLNLLIYLIFSNEGIIKLWGMKSGVCVLIGYYIGTSHTYTLARLQKFERQSYMVREELKSHQVRQEELRKAAVSDCLTGCCSREMGSQVLTKAFEEHAPFYICFVDINNLKPVNDNLGHDAGDRYISAVAYGLINAVGKNDMVCRYGGDEFLLMTTQEGIEKLKSGMENLQWVLDGLSNTSEYPFKLWVSYGIACSSECQDLNQLLKLVDERMYEAKRRDKEGSPKS